MINPIKLIQGECQTDERALFWNWSNPRRVEEEKPDKLCTKSGLKWDSECVDLKTAPKFRRQRFSKVNLQRLRLGSNQLSVFNQTNDHWTKNGNQDSSPAWQRRKREAKMMFRRQTSPSIEQERTLKTTNPRDQNRCKCTQTNCTREKKKQNQQVQFWSQIDHPNVTLTSDKLPSSCRSIDWTIESVIISWSNCTAKVHRRRRVCRWEKHLKSDVFLN